MSNLQNSTLNQTLCSNNENNDFSVMYNEISTESSKPNKLMKLLALFDLIPIICWCLPVVFGKCTVVIIHFLLMLFYSVSINSPKTVQKVCKRPPALILLLSMIFSLIFIICYFTFRYLKYNKNKQYDFIKYLDLDDKSEKLGILIYVMIAIFAVDLVSLIVWNSISIKWFKGLKTELLKSCNKIYSMLFLMSLSVTVSFSSNKYLLLIHFIFTIICLLYGLYLKHINKVIACLFWKIFILLIFVLSILISTDYIFKFIKFNDNYPRWARGLSCYITAFIASIFCANNRKGFIPTIRLIEETKSHILIKILAPFISLIMSFYFCFQCFSYLSFGSFVVTSLSSMFTFTIFIKTSPFVFAINVLLIIISFSIKLFKNELNTSKYIGIFIAIPVVSIFINCLRSNEKEIKISEMNKRIKNLLSIIATILIMGLYGVSAYFSSKYSTIITSLSILILLTFGLFGIYKSYVFIITTIVTLFSAIAQMVCVLFISKIQNSDIYSILFISVSETRENIYKNLMPIMIIFALSLFISTILVEPTNIFLSLLDNIILPILSCCLLIFLHNSVFKIIYLILFLFMMLSFSQTRRELRKTAKALYLFFASINIVINIMYNFEYLRKVIHSKRLLILFGFPKEGGYLNTGIDCIFLILTIFTISYNFSSRIEPSKFTKLKQSYSFKFIMMIFQKFIFYIFLISVYLGVIIDKKASIIEGICLISLGFQRIFNKDSHVLGIVLFIFYLTVYEFQIVVNLIPLSSKFIKIADYIGPSVETKLANAVNLLAVFCSYQYAKAKYEPVELSENIKFITKLLKQNIELLLHGSLAFSALYCNNYVIGPISAAILILATLKKTMTKVFASFLNFIMIIIITYIMLWSAIQWKSTTLNDYFLLSNITKKTITNSFMHLLATTLLLEFGIGKSPGFMNTVFTAHGFTIFSTIILIISFYIFDYFSLIHCIIWGIVCIVSHKRNKAYKKGIIGCLYFTVFVLLVQSLRKIPVIKNSNGFADKIFIFTGKYNIHWILIFIFEFIISKMIETNDYKNIIEVQEKRRENRIKRTEIFKEVYQLDEGFIKLYFNFSLEKIQNKFKDLTVTSSYTPYPITKEDLIRLENYEMGNQENSIEKKEDEENKTILMIVKSLVKSFFNWVVLKLVNILILLSDINIEPGISIPAMNKFKDFYISTIDSYKENRKLQIPEEWERFSQTIPYSFVIHFRLLRRLHLHYGKNFNNLQLLKKTISLLLKNCMSIILIALIIFYPFKEQSLISLMYLFLVYGSISFKITSYIQFIYYSIFVMFYKFIFQIPLLNDIIEKTTNSVKECKRKIPLLKVFGLSRSASCYLYDCFILIFSIFSYATHYLYPSMKNKSVGDTVFKRLLSRFTKYSSLNINLPFLIVFIDFIGFLTLLFFYGSWTSNGAGIFNMVSGSSSVSPLFVFYLIIHFIFLILTHIVFASQNYIASFIFTFLSALFSFIMNFFVLPSINQNCWYKTSFRFFVFLRIIAQLFMSLEFYVGFGHEPPKISRKKPLITYIKEIIFLNMPFLFPFSVIINWISTKTSISLFNTFVLKYLKSALKKQKASFQTLPPEKTETKIPGILILILMVLILFVPLMILSSSGQTTDINPAATISMQLGFSSLPKIYDSEIILPKPQFLNDKEQNEIMNLNEPMLIQYYSTSTNQNQKIEFPTGSMNEWSLSPETINITLKNLDNEKFKIYPYLHLSIYFNSYTSSRKVKVIDINKIKESELTNEQKQSLKLILNGTDDQEILIEKLIPVFISVPYSDNVELITGSNGLLSYDITFQVKRQNDKIYWNAIPKFNSNLPKFLNNTQSTQILLWSQPVPAKFMSSILNSAGGSIIGLYTFIIVTIGMFVTNLALSFFSELWVSRMHNPQKIIDYILAIEAYQLSGDLDQEYKLSEILLENMRSLDRIIQLTDIPDELKVNTILNNEDNDYIEDIEIESSSQSSSVKTKSD